MIQRLIQTFYVFSKGFAFSYLALFVFSVLGWITITAKFEWSGIIVSLAIGLIVWTAVFVSESITWLIMLLFTKNDFLVIGSTASIGSTICLFVTGSIPADWATITQTSFAQVVMSTIIVVIGILVDEERQKAFATPKQPKQKGGR